MCPSWKIWLRQWVSDDIPYMKWKIIQPCLKPPTSWSGFGWLWQLVKFHENHAAVTGRRGGEGTGSVPKVRDPRVTMVEGMTWDMTGTMQWGCWIFQLIFKVKQSKLWFTSTNVLRFTSDCCLRQIESRSLLATHAQNMGTRRLNIGLPEHGVPGTSQLWRFN